MRHTLILGNIALLIILVADYFLKFLTVEQHDKAGWLLIAVMLVSVVYSKLDDIEKKM